MDKLSNPISHAIAMELEEYWHTKRNCQPYYNRLSMVKRALLMLKAHKVAAMHVHTGFASATLTQSIARLYCASYQEPMPNQIVFDCRYGLCGYALDAFLPPSYKSLLFRKFANKSCYTDFPIEGNFTRWDGDRRDRKLWANPRRWELLDFILADIDIRLEMMQCIGE